MKLNKQISELVQTDFVPVEETKEGLLRGGFGEISAGGDPVDIANNCECNGNDCACYKNNCDCPDGKCKVKGNNCDCGTTTTTTTEQPGSLSFIF